MKAQQYIRNLNKNYKAVFYKSVQFQYEPIFNHQFKNSQQAKDKKENQSSSLNQSKNYGISELQKIYVNNKLQNQTLTPQKFNNYNPIPQKKIRYPQNDNNMNNNVEQQNMNKEQLNEQMIDQNQQLNLEQNIKQQNQYNFDDDQSQDPLWISLKNDAYVKAQKEPLLESFFFDYIFNHKSLDSAMVFILANKMANALLGQREWESIFRDLFDTNKELIDEIKADLKIVETMDAAFKSHINTLLYFKGFHGLGLTRCAQKLYQNDRQELAFIIQNRTSELFGMDMHPAAKFEGGIFFDHAHGLVIGETATIGSGTVILHNVTLGATGKEPHGSDRHPKIGRNCYIGSNVSILGNLNIGNNVKIGAGSIVLQHVPDNKTCVGVPAKILGESKKK